MTTTADRSTEAQRRFKVVGTRPIRHDGLGKVTGKDRYGADVHLPGMLHGKILRSPHAHARIKKIDASKAEALPGVKAIVTARDLSIIDDRPIDLAETLGNPRVLAENALAKSKALYKGHAIVALAATTPHIAEEALELIDVEYEVLKPLLDVREAMADRENLIHEDLTTHEVERRFTKGTDTGVHSNVASHLQFKQGDVEEAFREADVVVEREFTTVPVHQGYIEPQNSTAHWAADGHLTNWT
ncbi:MAG: molybdopterin cofactor-binding domain-containing protein, partial [Dehalococcoidia bacterium]